MRYFLLWLIVMFLLFKFWPEPDVPTAEESFIGPQLEPLNKMEQFQQDYEEGLDSKRNRIDKKADGGP